MPEWLHAWIGSGYQAVTFFFVLSGFILVYVYAGGREGEEITAPARTFLKARLARIGPAYHVALILLLPAYVYGFAVAKIVPPEQFFPAIVLVPTLLQSWYPPVSFSWNGPAWSLSVELFFYVLFPLLYRQSNRLSRVAWLATALCAVVAVSILRAHLSSLPIENSDGWRYFKLYFPPLHLGSFLFGMALGRLYLFGRPLSTATHTVMLAVGVTGLLLLLGFRGYVPPSLITDALIVPLCGLIIFGAARPGAGVRKLLASAWAILLGEASYSIYILHVAVIFWWQQVARSVLRVEIAGPVQLAIIAGLVVATSIVVFVAVERPMRRWILSRSPGRVPRRRV
jgi:peptidoglycan/LPS O-acetylase OafA/YrhL